MLSALSQSIRGATRLIAVVTIAVALVSSAMACKACDGALASESGLTVASSSDSAPAHSDGDQAAVHCAHCICHAATQSAVPDCEIVQQTTSLNLPPLEAAPPALAGLPLFKPPRI